MYRLFFRKAAFFAFAATTFFCLNACFEDDDSSSFAPTEKEQADSDKKQDDPDNQNGSNNQGVASNGSDKCPEVTSRSQFLNPDIDYGEITDERDGQTYKTVKIGKYTWFAQNLNYAYENSVCVDPQDKNCEIYMVESHPRFTLHSKNGRITLSMIRWKNYVTEVDLKSQKM